MSALFRKKGSEKEEGSMKLNYCPNCGKRLRKTNEFQMPYGLTADGPIRGYDVYCPKCKWSGMIEPDIIEKEKKVTA